VYFKIFNKFFFYQLFKIYNQFFIYAA